MAPEIVKSTLGNAAAPVVGASKNAYVTFLAGAGDYVKGVVGLVKGLRKVGAAFPLVVAILADVPVEHRRLLAEQGCILREIEPAFPCADADQNHTYVRKYFLLNYCKLRLWEFVEYERMIYMDADVQVFDNIDHLFELPSGYFYGVVDCVCEMSGDVCPQKLRWPQELGPQPPFYLNGGMFVFEPDLTTYHHLIHTLSITPPTPFAEQDFLNMFFREKMKVISPEYNLLVAMLWRHPEAVDVEKAKVVHYCVAGSKPWKFIGEEENMEREDMKMLVSMWWDIYNDASLDFNVAQRLTKGLPLSREVVVHYRSASSAA
ncbi:glycosyltransferase 8 [Salvia divinorum]|uniref:Hexosyltransferase n=1 Tax=Salvia divinorum TaxID=28513 RepID=A0ABD1IAS4_SALDI